MEIKVLGTGCPKCNKLENMVNEVIKDLNADATVTKVKDINEIAKAGVMLTPALMINGDIKLTGKLPSKEDLTKMIEAGL
jgi:small redox-active disulfide protein 2